MIAHKLCHKESRGSLDWGLRAFHRLEDEKAEEGHVEGKNGVINEKRRFE